MDKDLLNLGEEDEGLEVAERELSDADLAVEALLTGVEDHALAVVGDREDDIGAESTWPKPSAAQLEEAARIKCAKESPMPAELASLKEEFLRWRLEILGRFFDSKVWSERTFYAERDGGKLDYESEKARFIAGAERHYREDLPKSDYFDRKIVPLAIYMSRHDGRDAVEVAKDVLDTLKELMRMNTYGGTRKTVHSGVIDGIFEIAHRGGSWGENAGQYREFYNKYGKWVAYALAVHQGDISDEHYDGINYSRGTWELEASFGKVAQLVPEEYREPVFKAYVNYGNYYSGIQYLSRLPAVIEEIRKRGREDLLPRYFAFLEAAHPISSDGFGARGFPIFDAGFVIEQLDALEKSPTLKEEIFACAKDIVKYAGRSGSGCVPLFNDLEEGERLGSYYEAHSLNIPEFVRVLESAGLDRAKIVEVLEFPKSYPWLGAKAVNIMGKYLEIEANFVGGADALIKYLETLKATPESMYSVIDIAASDDYTADEKALILEVGGEVLKSLGNKSGSYFRQFADFYKSRIRKRGLIALLSKADEFRQLIEISNKFVSTCPPLRRSGSLSTDHYQELIENFYEHFGDRNFEACLRGYEVIFAKVGKYLADGDDGDFDSQVFFEVIRTYRTLPYNIVGKDPFGGEEVPDSDFETHARVLTDIALTAERPILSFRRSSGQYQDLLKMGLAPKLAGLAVMADSGEVIAKAMGTVLDEYEIPEPVLREIFEAVASAREIIRKVTNGEEVNHADIIAARKRVEVLQLDADSAKLIDKEKFRADMDRVAKINFFKSASRIGISDRSLDLMPSGLMESANESTRMAIAGMSILLAAGAAEFEGLESDVKALPVDSATSVEQLGELLSNGKYERKLREAVALILPRVEGLILNERKRMPGLFPVGGKIHTVNPVDEKLLAIVEKMFGLPHSTSFKLIHANHTLLLPPLPSAVELMMLVKVLESFGVVDLNTDELQICAPGRRPEENAGIIGSATLLSRTTGITYKEGAFQTTHDQTGARIMAYDAGVKLNGMPFDSLDLHGRTDILGSRDLTDIGRYQLLNTLAGHAEHQEFFAAQMTAFAGDYLKVLRLRGLDGVMHESAWVYDNAKEGDELVHHEKMVRRFTDAWMYASGRSDFGVIADVKHLIDDAERRVEALADVVRTANRGEYERLLSY